MVDLVQVGDSGLRRSGGYISEEFLPELRGSLAVRQYRQMADNDATIGAILFAIEMLCRQVTWDMQPVDDSSGADDGAEFAEQVLFDDMEMPWDSFISEVLSMLVYGYAPFETVWKLRKGDSKDPRYRSRFSDGKVGLRALSIRAQESVRRWHFAEDGTVIGLWQQPETGTEIYIPAEKLLLFRTRSRKNNPEGVSLLRNAWRSWKLKTRIEEIEGIGIERDLAGLPVVRIPGQFMSSYATDQEKAAVRHYEDLVQNIKRDRQEGVVLPGDKDEQGNYLYDLTLLTAGSSRAFDTGTVIDRYEHRMASSVLADFIFLGQQATGSFALSSDKTALFATALGTILKQIEEPINRFLLPQLWKLNGMKPETMPTLSHGDIEKPDLAQLGEFIRALSGSGATLFPDRDLENRLREFASLPKAPEEGAEGKGMTPEEQAKLDVELR
ncbi:phage portal protein family protein [Candidatus Contendibacter odensensis]|uniref:Portal protein n=1 Tax=Candidatus Contendobacter odensis Run_B_J11 TaxID=1400861 RepID=A0A7U7J480_9GAMM|nr:hypothetical protein [Candidatus Contendobacter odensis]CDH46956.1 conserved hypothetical protein [Candidatus Contendobacter odensis Run_B_J11]